MIQRDARAGSRSARWPARFCIPLTLLSATFAGAASAQNPSDAGLRPTMISVTFGGLRFLNDDMHDTYGMAPAVGLRIGKQMDERAEIFLGLQYGEDSGNPFETPDFRSARETELKLAPITFGARLNVTKSRCCRFYFGLALRYLWMSEKAPWSSSWDDPAEPDYSGWGWGLWFMAGPEWRDPEERFAAGLEVSFGPQAAVIKQGYSEREVDLSGSDVRFYLSALF